MSQIPVDMTAEILERNLDKDFRIYSLSSESVSLDDIKVVGQSLGVQFSSELLAHLSGNHRGIYVEANEDVWPRPLGGAFWWFLYGLHTYTADRYADDWAQIEHAGKQFQEGTGLTAVPILKVIGDANLYCVNPAAQIVHFDHDENTLEPVGLSFFELLERDTRELKERKERKKNGT